MEFERWLDGDPPPEMAEMLHAARSDEPRPEVFERTLAALGVGATVGAAGLIGAQASTLTKIAGSKLGVLLIVAKWGTVGLVGGVLCLGAATSTQRLLVPLADERPTNVVSTTHEPAGRAKSHSTIEPGGEPAREREVARDAPPAARFPDVTALSRPTTEPFATPSVARFEPVHEPGQRSSPDRGSSAPVDSTSGTQSASYQRELALVEAARAAVGARDPARALVWLAQHDREFGSAGTFAPEARLLRLQAYRLTGDSAQAREAARAILRADPRGPHADRAREVLRATP